MTKHVPVPDGTAVFSGRDFCAVLCRAEALPRDIEPQLLSLSPYRRARYEAAKSDAAHTQSLCASLALADALARFGFSECEMAYSVADGGKPFFANGCKLFFSLSHTSGAAVAVVSTSLCGVDIERQTGRDRTALARRFFHPDEADALQALPQDAREHAFLTLWTLKESYVKYTGRGLATPFSSFTFENGIFRKSDSGEAVHGLTAAVSPYLISAAGASLPASLQIHEWSEYNKNDNA